MDQTLALFILDQQNSNSNQAYEIRAAYLGIYKKVSRYKLDDKLRFVQSIYEYVHRKHLKTYKGYVSLHETILANKYDCLTGTAIFSMLLNEFEIPHQILEFETHLLITGNIEGTFWVLDPTDPSTGFITDKRFAVARLNKYQNSTSDPSALVDFDKPNRISLIELAGLQYYNLAVKSFNNEQFDEADHFLRLTEQLYPSSRAQNLKQLVVSSNWMALD
ncbi:MAG: hypothetical protein JXQ90_13220 [Cyclobacteriaceae bacterium]